MSAAMVEPVRELRGMRLRDLDQVMEIEREAYDFPWSEGIFRDCMRVGYSCWVMAADQRVLGYCIMSVVQGECHILNLCVRPSAQGQGLGREILTDLLELASINADSAFLEVRPSNAAAIKLYFSEGFNEVGRRKDYYPSDTGREDAVVLAKALTVKKAFFDR